MTSATTGSATSSRGSVDGLRPPASPDGTAPSGPEAAPASPSAPPASAAVQMTLGICGPTSSGSSTPADLSWSLVSRLRAQGIGSTACSGTWTERATPRGRSYWEHTPPAHPTGGSGCGGARWSSPVAKDGWGANPGVKVFPWLREQVVPWPTPATTDGNGGARAQGKQGGATLNEAVAATGPAPTGGGARARLNPRFCQWLMGYPQGWTEAAPSAAQGRSAGSAMR